jgi:trk system potassium uptake protein TrkH
MAGPGAGPVVGREHRPWERVLRVPITRPETIEVRPPTPPRPPVRAPLILALGFLSTILVGSLLLTLPIASRQGEVTPYLTALFTATSAVCVTGLVVVDTLTYWSPFGQAVILGLIQVGGLGFMTSSTVLFLFIGRRTSLRERLLLRESHGVSPLGGVLRLTRRVVLVTALIEGMGATLLFVRFALEFPPDWALWMGVFHSVSAFNNAGFDIMGGFRSLTIFNRDPVVLFTFGLLLVLGGISFTVIADLWDTRNWGHLLLDTKLVLFATGTLLATGTLGVLILEQANPATLGPLDAPTKLVNALFTAATPRTAGFNSIDTGQMTQAGLLLTIALMYIGAASGSTGGGIKVNTFGVLTSAVVSSMRGRERTTAFGRELPQDHINRALTVALLSLGLVFTVTLVLSGTERFTLVQLLFEATSAFGTVGLSTGITPDLSPVGKLVIILTMYLGRVGPLTVALALAARQKPELYRFPEGRVKIG